MNSDLLSQLLEGSVAALLYFDSVGSTNQELIRLATNGAPMYTLIAAQSQTDGYGSRGRKFYSPDSGAYFSLLLPDNDAGVTARAAVSACEAIEAVFNVSVGIKWPNDLILDGKKVGGILAEAFPGFTVLGVGLNVFRTEFPELPNAASIAEEPIAGVRERLIAEFVARYRASDDGSALKQFRNRSVLIGRDVTITHGRFRRAVRVVGIDDSYRLIVRLPNGTSEYCTSGEVTLNNGT